MLQLKNILSISLFIALFITVGCSPSQYGFEEWDGNNNDLIESEEFHQVLTDNDYYSDWDTDGNGILTEEEWGSGTETWGEYDGNLRFSDWDLNNDSELTEDEFGDGFFDTVDDDDNDTIDQDEWDIFDSEEDGLF